MPARAFIIIMAFRYFIYSQENLISLPVFKIQTGVYILENTPGGNISQCHLGKNSKRRKKKKCQRKRKGKEKKNGK
jgi:hypothetical protein